MFNLKTKNLNRQHVQQFLLSWGIFPSGEGSEDDRHHSDGSISWQCFERMRIDAMKVFGRAKGEEFIETIVLSLFDDDVTNRDKPLFIWNNIKTWNDVMNLFQLESNTLTLKLVK